MLLRRLTALLLISIFPLCASAAVTVKIEGISGDLLDNVKARLSILKQANDKLSASEIHRLDRRAQDEIREALQPFGYYTPTIVDSLTGEGTDRVARYQIDPGQRTHIKDVNFQILGEGANYKPLLEARDKMPLKTGAALDHSSYDNTRDQMLIIAQEAGFLDVHWTKTEMRVRVEQAEADINWTLDTGRRYYFGPITIAPTVFSEDFLRRYIVLKEGEPFDSRRVLAQQFAISDLNYFNTVELVPDRAHTSADGHVPVTIETTLRPQTQWTIGPGYGTDTGARITLGNEWRWVNKHGHKVSTDARIAQRKTTIASEYRIPQGDRADEWLSLTAGYTHEDLTGGKTDEYTTGVALLRNPGKWQRRYYIEYTHEITELASEKTTADLFTPGISLTRSDLDDQIYARKGWYAYTDVHGADETLLSSATFIQGQVLLRAALPLGSQGRWLFRTQFGVTQVDDFSRLPASERFFAGGDDSVRGYAYESLGDHNDDGELIGGSYLQTYSIEAEVPVKGNIGVAAFFDTGGAGRDPDVHLYSGTGLGLRYRAPFGSVRIDLAHPLASGYSGVRLHIGVKVGL